MPRIMIDHGHPFRLKPRWIHVPPLRLKPHWTMLVRPRVVAHCRAKLQDWARRHVQTGREGTLLCPDNPIARHSGEGRNPAKINSPRSGQNHDVVPLSREIFNQLDSGLRRNDAVNALAHLQAMLGSYWGHFAHAQSVRLRRALFNQFDWLKTLFVLHPDGQLSPRWILQGVTFAGQAAALKAEWPQVVSISPARKSLENCLPLVQCLIQKGNRWLLLSHPEQEFNEQATQRLTASFRRQGIAYVCANQTGWLRHGTRRREVQEWFSPNAVVS